MKNIILNIVIIAQVCFVLPMHGMEYTYAQATSEDVPSVLELINTHANNDSDKIVIVPKAFRQAYVQSAVNTGRLFVAKHNDHVIGYKKLFCITDPQELKETLIDEIRCMSTPVACGAVLSPAYDEVQSIASTAITELNSKKVTYVYTGADFTHPAHRGKGVNATLMDYALAVSSRSVVDHGKEQGSAYLAIVYGLTESNAGKKENVLDGRTRGILSHFAIYATSIAKALGVQSPEQFMLSRHCAFKPSFASESTECVPLPDEQAIPGYGCIITCALERSATN